MYMYMLYKFFLVFIIALIEVNNCIAQTTTPVPPEDCVITRLTYSEKVVFSMSVVGAFFGGVGLTWAVCFYISYREKIQYQVLVDEKQNLVPQTKRMIMANIDRTC